MILENLYTLMIHTKINTSHIRIVFMLYLFTLILVKVIMIIKYYF